MLPKNGLEDCIKACWDARHSVQKTLFQHCLQMGGEHVAPAHVELMVSCMEICQAAADAMTRSSPLHTSVCAACANVCEACADSCETILCEDEKPCVEMQRCADICRACATACRTMGQESYIPPETYMGERPQA
jgi:hypothetical protein